jgi:hypothetical protein
MTKDGVKYEADDVFVLESEVAAFTLSLLYGSDTAQLLPATNPTQDYTVSHVLYMECTLNGKTINLKDCEFTLSANSEKLRGFIESNQIYVAER